MDYFLTSKLLGFRRWREEDFPLAMGLWGDPEVSAYIGGPFTEKMVRSRLQQEIKQELETGLQYWPFFLLDGNRHVGCAGLRPYRAEEQVYELGIHLRHTDWGKGLAKEAAQAVIDYGFGTLGATALFAGHHPRNEASRRLLFEAGFYSYA